MSAEADEVAAAVERLLVAYRSGVVTQWVLGTFPNCGFAGTIGLKVLLRDGRAFEGRGSTVGAAVDQVIGALAKSLEGKA